MRNMGKSSIHVWDFLFFQFEFNDMVKCLEHIDVIYRLIPILDFFHSFTLT